MLNIYLLSPTLFFSLSQREKEKKNYAQLMDGCKKSSKGIVDIHCE